MQAPGIYAYMYDLKTRILGEKVLGFLGPKGPPSNLTADFRAQKVLGAYICSKKTLKLTENRKNRKTNYNKSLETATVSRNTYTTSCSHSLSFSLFSLSSAGPWAMDTGTFSLGILHNRCTVDNRLPSAISVFEAEEHT